MLKKVILSISFVICVAIIGSRDVHGTVSPGWEKHIIGAQTSPIYVYVEDIDGDGALDVAATSDVHPWGSNSEIAWYRNNMQQGMPWEKTVISSDDPAADPIAGAAGIIMADIDGDGRKDAVVVTGNVITPKGDVYWFQAPADPAAGPWQRFTLETGVDDSYFKVYTFDANNDGEQDIAIGGNRGAVLFVNPGNPEEPGAEWTKIPLPEGTGSSIYLDDMNNDGKIDIVNSHTGFSAMDYQGTVSWLDVTDAGGDIAFNRTMIDSASVRAFDVNTMDINGDGKKDVVASSFMSPEVFWYEQPENSGDSWMKHVVSNTFDGTDIYTGDIDGDGSTDLIISGLFDSRISWFSYSWDNGQAVWVEHSLDDAIDFPGDISLNDLDGDGDLDVVVAGMGTNQMIWYENKRSEANTCLFTFVMGEQSSALPRLRTVRDTCLKPLPGGEAIIKSYYSWSPRVVNMLLGFERAAGMLPQGRLRRLAVPFTFNN